MKSPTLLLLAALAAQAFLGWDVPRQITSAVSLVDRNLRLLPSQEAGAVSIGWDKNTDAVTTGYLVRFNEVGKAHILDLRNVGNVDRFTATGLPVGASYQFSVYAYSPDMLSDMSEVLTVTVPQAPPPPPPPACSAVNAPGSSPAVSVVVQSFDPIAARSDPKGTLVRFDAGSSEAIVRVELDLEGDGEPSVPLVFPVGVGFDGRYVRALSFKPTINGTWPLLVSAEDATGRKNATRCLPGVTVTF